MSEGRGAARGWERGCAWALKVSTLVSMASSDSTIAAINGISTSARRWVRVTGAGHFAIVGVWKDSPPPSQLYPLFSSTISTGRDMHRARSPKYSQL